MKVYTVQHNNFLNIRDLDGFIAPEYHESEAFFKKNKNDFYYNENCTQALLWMKNEYAKFTKRSQVEDFYLIWVWPTIQSIDWRYIPKDYSVYEFEVPAKEYKSAILWSNFIDWHLPLNGYEKEHWSNIFDINVKLNKKEAQGVTTRLNTHWLCRRIKKEK